MEIEEVELENVWSSLEKIIKEASLVNTDYDFLTFEDVIQDWIRVTKINSLEQNLLLLNEETEHSGLIACPLPKYSKYQILCNMAASIVMRCPYEIPVFGSKSSIWDPEQRADLFLGEFSAQDISTPVLLR